ncbi:MAG TPA: tripartite tricarboxylate transporter substrate binding protein [Bordetella sp.]|nr:tripartite tricarboxylate transporter substrate binding protein [Bordetella sp.]
MKALASLCVAALSLALSAPGQAQTRAQTQVDAYPSRPIRMIVAYGAGGANDIIARIVAKELTGVLGQSVVVFNSAGAGGTIGAGEAARAAPDGYTLLMAAGAHALAPSLYKKLSYDIVKDFTPVGLVGRGSYVVSLNNDVPANTVDQLIAYARKPGVNLRFASSGVGAPPHLAGVLFETMTGTDMTHVPYKSEPESLNDLVAGRVEMGFITVSNAMPLIRAGRMRGVAVTSATRSSVLPELPTLAEAGLAGFDVSTWWGVLAPAGTPPEIIGKLHAALARIIADPQYKSLLAVQGMDVAGSPSPGSFADFIKAEKDRYAGIARTADIHPE